MNKSWFLKEDFEGHDPEGVDIRGRGVNALGHGFRAHVLEGGDSFGVDVG